MMMRQKNVSILSIMESILFASGDPVTLEQLSCVFDIPEESIRQSLKQLKEKYDSPESGLHLLCKDNRVQLVTKGTNAEHIEAFVKNTAQETLSKAALEVLSVIAYRGPVTRSYIEAVRGVNCSVTLRNLLMRELIERKEVVNDSTRGYSYVVSFPFLKELGLSSISELPEYEALRRDDRLAAIQQSKTTIFDKTLS